MAAKKNETDAAAAQPEDATATAGDATEVQAPTEPVNETDTGTEPDAEPETEVAPQVEAQKPSEIPSGNETAFSKERLLADAIPLTGYDRHVLVGALNRSDAEYFTVGEAKRLAQNWLGTPVSAG